MADNKNQKLFDAYISAYLFELENQINENKDFFKNIKFQFDEANSDKDYKQTLKAFIISKCNRIQKTKKVKFDSCSYDIDKNSFKISNVYIPGEYKDALKGVVKVDDGNARSVIPDMVLECKIGNKTFYELIELKSTKGSRIPGSSIKQVNPNDWLIFVKHNQSGFKALTGQYKNSISGILQFPDRSPRPEVSFDELQDWINKYRLDYDGVLELKKDKLEDEKNNLLTDWQSVLSKRWIEVLKGKKKTFNPWFENNLRKFIIDFLDFYDKLSEDNKVDFKKNVIDNIEE